MEAAVFSQGATDAGTTLPMPGPPAALLASTMPLASSRCTAMPTGTRSAASTSFSATRSIDNASTPSAGAPTGAAGLAPARKMGWPANRIQRPVKMPRVTLPSTKPPRARVASTYSVRSTRGGACGPGAIALQMRVPSRRTVTRLVYSTCRSPNCANSGPQSAGSSRRTASSCARRSSRALARSSRDSVRSATVAASRSASATATWASMLSCCSVL